MHADVKLECHACSVPDSGVECLLGATVHYVQTVLCISAHGADRVVYMLCYGHAKAMCSPGMAGLWFSLYIIHTDCARVEVLQPASSRTWFSLCGSINVSLLSSCMHVSEVWILPVSGQATLENSGMETYESYGDSPPSCSLASQACSRMLCS